MELRGPIEEEVHICRLQKKYREAVAVGDWAAADYYKYHIALTREGASDRRESVSNSIAECAERSREILTELAKI